MKIFIYIISIMLVSIPVITSATVYEQQYTCFDDPLFSSCLNYWNSSNTYITQLFSGAVGMWIYSGSYIYPNSTFADDVFIPSGLLNVSGTVNASTFFGNLSCSYITGATSELCTISPSTGGKNTTPPYLYNNTDTIFFNETELNNTIDLKLYTKYYNATAFDNITGNPTGYLSDTYIYDGIPFNISESAGSPGLDLRFNFTNVIDFNEIIIRMKMDGSGHNVKIQIFDIVNNDWEDYASIIEVDTYQVIEIGVYDSKEHINTTDGNKVIVRFVMEDNGNPTHDYYFDWVTLSKGPATFSTQEIDPLSFHRLNNLNNTGYNITSDYLFGNLSCDYVTGSVSNLCTIVDTEPVT